jgi:outer membrane protein TolC
MHVPSFSQTPRLAAGLLATGLLVAWAAWTGTAQAQSTAADTSNASALTLQAAITQAQAQSLPARQARLRFVQSEWQFQGYEAQFWPSVRLQGSAPGLERSIVDVQQDDGSVRYVQQSRTFSTARLQVEQAVPFTGGTLSVSSGLGRVTQFGAQSGGQWQATPISVGLDQPLFQFNPLRWARRLEPLQLRIAEQGLRGDMAGIAVDATARFFDVYLAQINRDVAAFNVAVNDTVYALSQGRYEVGRIAENELLQTELELLNAQNALSEARLTLDRSRQDLRQLLNAGSEARVRITPPSGLPDLTIDPAVAVAQAKQNRADFTALERERVAARRDVVRAERQNGFSATIRARYGFNQSAAGIGDVYQNPLDQQQLGLSLQLPLFRAGAGRAEVEVARAARRETEAAVEQRRRQLEQEVYFEARQLQQQRQQVGIAAKADTVASRRFEVARKRYAVGKIDIRELFNAQRQKDQARRSYIQSLRQFWVSYYQLRRLTLYDFQAGRPLQRTPPMSAGTP